MSGIEPSLSGVTYRFLCGYCYEQGMRDAGNFGTGYDFEAITEAMEVQGGKGTLFGGKPLLAPIEHIAEDLAYAMSADAGPGFRPTVPSSPRPTLSCSRNTRPLSASV